MVPPRAPAARLPELVTAFLAAAWLALVVAGTGGPEVVQKVSNIGQVLTAGAAAAGCWHAGRRATGRIRLAWVLLGGAAASWGGGQVAWAVYELALGRELPFPSVADVGFLSAVPLAAAALLALPSGTDTVTGRARTVLDGLIVGSSLLLCTWVQLLGPVASGEPAGSLPQIISLAYPIGDIVLITIVTYALLARRAATRQVPLALVGAGLVAIAAADTGFAYLTLVERYASGSVVDAGWVLGWLLVFLASRRSTGAGRPEDDAGAPMRTAAGVFLPYFAVCGALAASVFELARTGHVDAVVSWTRSVLIAMLVLRQVLTLLENRDLNDRLRERMTALEASEQRFEALVHHSSDVVTVLDPAGRITYQSESSLRVFGYRAAQVQGLLLREALPPGAAAALADGMDVLREQPFASTTFELDMPHADGRTCRAEVTLTNLCELPSVGGFVCNTRDVSERRQLEEQLVHQAFHDSLTALANRALFKDRLEHALDRRRAAADGTVAVLFLDLDDFKTINDSLGHATGDLLLTQVAERLRTCVRPTDTVARLGGDEFAILLDDIADPADVVGAAERIVGALAEPFTIDGVRLQVGGSIGVATTDSSGVTDGASDQLLRNADLAMYRAKASGSRFEQFDQGMHADLVHRLEVERDLSTALAEGQLLLHYQPTVDLETNRVVGVEALLRWAHPERGMVPPLDFIPVAEASGLIGPIGAWVLEEACRQAAAWRAQPGGSHLTMSVNVSGAQVTPELPDVVRGALAASGLPSEALVLEMTESILMNPNEMLEILGQLKELGVRLAIDDFGTGYSSLSYLHHFPIDVLKIDRSFVDRLGDGTESAEMVQAIVHLGRSLLLTTVAEGIETDEQLEALQRMGCELGQGYHLSRPTVPERISELLGVTAPLG